MITEIYKNSVKERINYDSVEEIEIYNGKRYIYAF
jgi:hypothetical protein